MGPNWESSWPDRGGRGFEMYSAEVSALPESRIPLSLRYRLSGLRDQHMCVVYKLLKVDLHNKRSHVVEFLASFWRGLGAFAVPSR
jgi:hypothetical protein